LEKTSKIIKSNRHIPISLIQFNTANCTGLFVQYQGTSNPFRVRVNEEKKIPRNRTIGFKIIWGFMLE